MKIKFQGFVQGSTVTMSALQNSIERGPITVSAWQQGSSNASFTLQVQVNGHNTGSFRDITPGETIEALAPLPIRCRIQNVAGFTTDDKRDLWADIDYGERYTFTSHSDPDIPLALRKMAGSEGGYYPGFASGHALRGANMAGDQVLTRTYTGGPGPTGTIDQTITATVTDGIQTATVSFTVRLIHPEIYYLDRAKTLAPASLENTRDGIVYVSRDGDFTGALPEQAQTNNQGAIEHVTIPNGRWSQFSFQKADLSNFPGSSGYPECIALYFKEGEEFDLTTALSVPWLLNTTIGTWHPSTGTAKAVIRGQEAFSFEPNQTGGMIKDNSDSYLGLRLVDIIVRASDFNVSDAAYREWWNILKYSNRTGTFSENTETNQLNGGWTGELISNSAGVYSQVISDDGIDTLLVRQIVDISAVPSGTDAEKYDERRADFATFTDGDTLTGATSGATCTFVAAESRQNRGYKTAGSGLDIANAQGVLVDRCEVEGAAVGINVGEQSVISDTVVRNCWNYGVQNTTGITDFSESGVIVVQPANYEGSFRPLQGAVNPNRNAFQTTSGDARVPSEMAVSHSCRRLASMRTYTQHYCGGRWFGGHGAQHQPMHRFATGGSTAEGELQFVMYGCFHQGGNNQVQFNTLDDSSKIPYTPDYLMIERCHLLSDFCSATSKITSAYSNFVVRNCLLEFPVTDLTVLANITFTNGAAKTYNFDPDVNAINPVIEFNTFIFEATNATSQPVVALPGVATPVRSFNYIWRNNAWGINLSKVGSVDTGILEQNDDPAIFYDADYKPLPTAKAYQEAEGTVPTTDALGVTRPNSDASKGAFEPL